METMSIEEDVELRLKLDNFNQCEDGVEEVIISRLKNTISELKNGKITNSFRIPQPISVVQRLTVFYSYEPKLKHYLFMNGSDLIILRKVEGAIKIANIYKEVANIHITDPCNSGKPYLHIYLAQHEKPIVTDCVKVKTLSPATCTNVQTFASYIQKSMLRIRNAENVLREKTKMVSKLSNVLAFNCDDDRIMTTIEQVVFLREGLSSSFTGLPAKGNALSVGKPWYKTHLGCWVVGFPIINLSKQDIYCFEMFITHEFITVKKTLLFTLAEKAEQIDIYSQSSSLPIGEYGVVVAVVEEPHLIHETFILKCACRFDVGSSDETQQCFLGSLEITAPDLGENGNDKLFVPNLSVNDLISIQAASIPFELSFNASTFVTDFLDSLVSKHSFSRLTRSVFLNWRTNGIFPTLLLIVDLGSNKIRTFVRAENDFLLLTHKLRDNMKFEHPKSNPLHAIQNTFKEIKYIKGMVIQELIGAESNTSPPPAVNMEDAFHDMMLLEIDSAAAMTSLKMHSLYNNFANQSSKKWNNC